jgi:hypothetical protein
MVVGRTVLGAYVSALTGGVDSLKKPAGDDVAEEKKWADTGAEVFKGENGQEMRKEVVEGVLVPGGLATWCEEQASSYISKVARSAHSSDDSLATTPCGDFGGRRGLARSGKSSCSDTPRRGIEVSCISRGIRPKLISSRVSDDDKLAVYVKIVRLMLEVCHIIISHLCLLMLTLAVWGEWSGPDVPIESFVDQEQRYSKGDALDVRSLSSE